MASNWECAGIDGVIQPGGLIKPVVTGFDFIEGAIWHPVEQTVIFSDILGNSIYRWSAAGGLQKLRRHSYMANGNAYDHSGGFITCEHATSRLSRTNLTNNTYEILATHFEDKQLNSPNDVVVKSDGSIYFTDPTSGRSAGYGVPRAPELPFSGVYRLEPESNTLTLLVDDFAKPNGLCFSADETLLYVNDTERQHIRVFDVGSDGLVSNTCTKRGQCGRIFAQLEGNAPGVADGMKIDSAGHVYACGPGGIHIFDPEGSCLGVVEMPEVAANFVFGDEDLCTLYITATTTLYSLRVQIPGHNTFM